jgi:hypothetical protein
MEKNNPNDSRALRLRAEAAALLGIKEQHTKGKESTAEDK